MIIRISRVIFILMLVELCLGGGGRFTSIGPVSLRMILFSIALLMSVLLLIKKKSLPSEIWKLMVGFVVMITIGIIVGLQNSNPKDLILEDVKPLSYFLVLPFFYLTIDETMIANVIKIIKASSVLMAAIFILILIVINSGLIPFYDFYSSTFKSGELFFRGEVTFFYKGFLFFGLGTIFYYFLDYSKRKKYFIIILITAIILSVTRGLLFSLAFTFSIYFLIARQYMKAVYGFILVGIIAIWGSSFILATSRLFDAHNNHTSYSQADPTLLGDRNYSDNGRLSQAKEVWQEVSLPSTLIGHGFGAGTPSRPVHMEISYLEIFHKQGLIGFIFWGCLAWVILVWYREVFISPVANAFFYSAIFIFIESLTNQYFNNPIGMSVLLLSLCCLHKLKAPQ
jgi:hypothetical protein